MYILLYVSRYVCIQLTLRSRFSIDQNKSCVILKCTCHVLLSLYDNISKIGQCENTVEPLSLLTAGYKRKNTNVMLITSPYNM